MQGLWGIPRIHRPLKRKTSMRWGWVRIVQIIPFKLVSRRIRFLHAMDYCQGKLMCPLGNYTARVIALIGKKSIDEMGAARDLDGTNRGCGG